MKILPHSLSSGTGLLRLALIASFVAFFVRAALFLYITGRFGSDALIFGDTRHYLELADSVLSGGGYVYDGVPETFRAPGYPAYLMLFRLLHVPLTAASIVQFTIGSFIAGWTVWFAAAKLALSNRAALIAGIIAAIEPVQVYYSVILLPDVFFALAALTVFSLALYWFDTRSLGSVAVAGIAIGVGNFVRPAMIYLPIFLCILFIGKAWWDRGDMRRAIAACALIVLIPFAVMSPWYFRNKEVNGQFAFMSAADYNLYSYGATVTEAAFQKVPYEQMKQEMLAKARAEAPNPNLTSFENASYFRSKAVEIISAHPVLFAQQYLFGLGAFWAAGNYQYIFKSLGVLSPPSESISYSVLFTSHGPVVALKAFAANLSQPFIMVALFDRIAWAAAFLLSCVGIIRYRRQAVGQLAALFWAYFSITILATVIGVEARHRYALNPIIFALVVAVVYALYNRYHNRTRA